MSIEDGIELVASEAQKPQFQTDEHAMKIIRDTHLATVAQTYLMHFPGTYALDFDVSADSASRRVIIGGTIATNDIRSLEEDIYSALAGSYLIKNIEIQVSAK